MTYLCLDVLKICSVVANFLDTITICSDYEENNFIKDPWTLSHANQMDTELEGLQEDKLFQHSPLSSPHERPLLSSPNVPEMDCSK